MSGSGKRQLAPAWELLVGTRDSALTWDEQCLDAAANHQGKAGNGRRGLCQLAQSTGGELVEAGRRGGLAGTRVAGVGGYVGRGSILCGACDCRSGESCSSLTSPRLKLCSSTSREQTVLTRQQIPAHRSICQLHVRPLGWMQADTLAPWRVCWQASPAESSTGCHCCQSLVRMMEPARMHRLERPQPTPPTVTGSSTPSFSSPCVPLRPGCVSQRPLTRTGCPLRTGRSCSSSVTTTTRRPLGRWTVRNLCGVGRHARAAVGAWARAAGAAGAPPRTGPLSSLGVSAVRPVHCDHDGGACGGRRGAGYVRRPSANKVGPRTACAPPHS